MSEIVSHQIEENRRKTRKFIVWATLAGLLIFAGLSYALIKLDNQSQEILANQSTINNLSTALKDQTDQFVDCVTDNKAEELPEGCEEPVAEEPDKIVEDTVSQPVPTVKGEKGDKGDPPSFGTVLGAVNVFCQPLNGCSGPKGIAGQDGINGLDGVNGKDGADGLNGKDGLNGTNGVDGKDGVTPSNELIYSLIKQCFDSGDCVAPTGPQGPQGEKGEQGAPGKDGVQGPEGPEGPEGPQGVQGPAGDSCAYTDFIDGIEVCIAGQASIQ